MQIWQSFVPVLDNFTLEIHYDRPLAKFFSSKISSYTLYVRSYLDPTNWKYCRKIKFGYLALDADTTKLKSANIFTRAIVHVPCPCLHGPTTKFKFKFANISYMYMLDLEPIHQTKRPPIFLAIYGTMKVLLFMIWHMPSIATVDQEIFVTLIFSMLNLRVFPQVHSS